MTKRSCENRHHEVTAVIWIEPLWHRFEHQSPLAVDIPAWDKRHAEEERADAEFWERMEREWGVSTKALEEFNGEFGTPRVVREARARAKSQPAGNWPGWYETRHILAIALGATEPQWVSGSWWHDHVREALDWVQTASEVARIAIPDWPNLPVVRELLASRERWQRAHSDEPASGFGITYALTVPGRPPVLTVNYPSFVDLGVYLMGMTNSLAILAGDPSQADALMDKYFELSTSYTEFLLSLKPEPIDGLCGFGGDATCMLSPSLYERYGAGWDARLFEFVRRSHNTPADLPCNLHSCGPSAHLYDAWGRHPRRDNITTMQTRLIPGTVRKLRENLPGAELELTIRPPHFDVARAAPEELKDLLVQSARDAELRDAHLVTVLCVQRPEDLPRAKQTIAACRQALETIRRS